MSPLTPTAPGLPHNNGQGSRPPGQVGRQESLQQPLQEPPQQSPQQPPQTFNKLQKIRRRGRFQDFYSS